MIQKKSQCHLREITWKDSDDLCLDLMPTIWVLNWAQKEGAPVHMPLLLQPEGRQSTKMDHSFPATQYT